MKILHIGKYYPPFLGGVEKVNYDLVEKLNLKDDCQIDELCFCHKKDYVEVFSPKGYRLFRVPISGVKFSTPLPKGLLRRYYKIRNDYDIIHLHVPNPIATIAMLLIPTKAKIVVHWHSDIIKQKNLLKMFLPFQNALLKKACAIIATSENYAKYSDGLKPFSDKVVIVPIGLDHNEMVYKEEAVQSIKQKYGNKKIILSIGRLTYYKGHRYLIEAAKYLNDDTIVVIGGVGELESNLKDLIERNGVSDKVKMIGRVPQDLIYAYYKAADVFCLPSITKAEAYGVVLVESLAMGTPIVSCNIEGSGVTWVNQDGETGYNVPVENAEALAEKLNNIICDDNLRKRLSDNCVRKYNELFSLDRMVEKTYSIYKKIIPGD